MVEKLVLVLLLLPNLALAAPLSLQDALDRATGRSLDVQLQSLSTEEAEASWLADPRAGSPSVRLGLRNLDPTAVALDPEVVARLRMPLPRPWDLATAAQQGRATVEREQAELSAVEQELNEAVTTRFHALPLLRDAAAVAGELSALRTQHLALVQDQRTAGLATAIDWLESEEERRDAADNQAARDAEVRKVEAELRWLLGWPDGEVLELAASDVDALMAAPLPELEEHVRLELERAPRLAEARAEIDRAAARLSRLQLQVLPWLDWLEAGVVDSASKAAEIQLGVAIDVPIYQWSPDRTRAASRELAGAKLRLEEVEERVAERARRQRRDVTEARDRLAVARAHLQAIEEAAGPLVPLADAVLRVELEARILRARLRERRAVTQLVAELDRL